MDRFVSSLVGVSAAIGALREEIARVSQSSAKVLIVGESGVGKELVAADLHALSPRAARPFVPINCAGLPEDLLESELFGHVRGSFTGAYRDKPGRLNIADRGTVFLDEIGEMTPRMQGLLLRFLQTGELQKVGGERAEAKVDVRVIAATNRDLPEMVRQGLFREDLFYRINVLVLRVPPLRDRREDIPVLAQFFLDRFNRQHSSPVRSFDSGVMAALTSHAWPGNVRELENTIERLVVTGRHARVEIEHLPEELRTAGALNGSHLPVPLQDRRHTVVDELLEKLTHERQSFWTTVYPLYMEREITKSHVREIVRRALADARGNYKVVARMFNMAPSDYKRFLRFLRKHGCAVPFMPFRR